MVTIDEKKKLLKMKEKFLEVSFNGNVDEHYNTVLDEYKTIATELDQSLYDSIISKIKNSNYDNLPLDEKKKFLLEIYNDYILLKNNQENYSNVYKKYANEDIKLSNLDDILIDDIKLLIDSITKYLENVENIKENELLLHELNMQLIEEDKKANVFKDRLIGLENELRNNILKTEGRIYNSIGEIEYTSISKEYSDVNLDLKTILNDREALSNELENTTTLVNDLRSKEAAAEICYKSSPNSNYMDIYNNIRLDTTKAEYKLVLLKIADLVTHDVDTYEASKNKRFSVLELIRNRTNLLNSLDIKYLYDPFDRIDINEQLEIIESFNENVTKIKSIRKDMDRISKDNDMMQKDNYRYFNIITNNHTIFKDNTTFDLIADNYIDENDRKVKSNVLSNQVISITDIPQKMFIDRVYEKTNGVINRVYEMINGNALTDTDNDIVPDLVIDSSEFQDLKEEKNSIFNDNINDSNDIFNDIAINIIENEDAGDELMPSLAIDSTNNDGNNNDIDGFSNSSLTNNEDMFQEVEPFTSTSLFNDRYDDGNANYENESDTKLKDLKIDLSNDKNTQELIENINRIDDENNMDVTMPEVNDFWVTKDDNLDNGEDVLSFDEQIANLIDGDSKSKVKKIAN